MSDFDRDCNTYTPDGKILQLEYAYKAVENAEYMPF
jgi:20S proteasome alpha/beta subunit